MELVHHPGWEAITHSTAVNPPWFFNGSQGARLSRWLLQYSMNHAPGADRRIAVQQMTLARIMDLHEVSTVNYLKMDCEGSEFEILRSIDPAHWARIERVVLEYHDFGPDRKHGELVKILRNNGFDVEVIHSMVDYLFAYCLGVRLGFIWAKKPASA